MCKYYLILCVALVASKNSFSECLNVGLLGEFNTTTNKTSVVYGKEIKAGVEIAKTKLQKCFVFKEIDINNNIANINDLIKKHNKEGIYIFLGLGTTEQVLGAIEGLRQTGSILISPTATSDSIYEKSSNVILMSPTNTKIVKKIIKESKERKIKKVLTIFSPTDPYSKSIKTIMELESKDHLDNNSVGIYLGKGANLKELNNVKIEEFDAIFLPLFEHEVLKVLAYVRKAKSKVRIIGSDSWGTHSKIINTLPLDEKENVLFTVSIYPTFMKEIKDGYFYKEYKKINKKEPTDLSAFSFDAIRAMEMAYGCLVQKVPRIDCFRGKFESSIGKEIIIEGQDLHRDVFIKEKL